ncbi:MAG: LysR family transcriptional regulator [Paracoccaceae bacterium]
MKNIAAFDLNLLVAFHALMAEGNVTRAADRIGLAQSSMSNALNRLRESLGDPLFVRAAGGMRPTELALKIAPDVSTAITAAQRAINHNRDFDPAVASFDLRLATSDYFEFVFLPEIIDRVQKEAPGASIRTVPFVPSEITEQLDQNEVDLGIGSTDLPAQRFKARHLVEEKLVCVCAPNHPVVAKGLNFDTFIKAPQILFSIRGDGTGMIDQVLSRKGLKRKVAVTTSSLFGLSRLTSNANLIAVTTQRLAAQLRDNAELRVLPLPLDEDTFTFFLYWEESQPKTAEREWLIRIIEETIGNQPLANLAN